ncbi:unnamed protein product [Larinioides sclopetarius]|uniref:Uncharacterized protein n=1 Tax=Larinioides sclopetarius TaxID=280406 RepID=A0AAV2B257_9ARAC
MCIISYEVLKFLKSFNSVTFWLSKELHTYENHNNISHCLKEKAFYIKDDLTALEALKRQIVLTDIINKQKPIKHKSIKKFTDYEDAISEDLNNPSSVEGVKWSTLSPLNTTLMGHREREITLLTGQSGVGKTTFACQLSLDICKQMIPK